MRGYRIESYIGSLQELPGRYSDDIPDPEPTAGQVLVQIVASGLNFFDLLQLQGKYQTQPPFPWIAGFEFSGVITSTAQAPMCPFKPGTRVFGAHQGAYADQIAVPHDILLEIPSNISFEEAAGISVTYPTSYSALADKAKVQPGETVLVHAAAGGVGMAACQVAKALGATVIACAGSPEKLEIAKRLGGADHAIDYTKVDWVKEVKALTGGKGVNVVYDPVGLVERSLRCIAWEGRIVVIGFAGGKIEKIPTNLILLKRAEILGEFWGGRTKNEPSAVASTWKVILDLMSKGKLKPAVFSTRFNGLRALADGLKALSERGTWGKAVLLVDQERLPKL